MDLSVPLKPVTGTDASDDEVRRVLESVSEERNRLLATATDVSCSLERLQRDLADLGEECECFQATAIELYRSLHGVLGGTDQGSATAARLVLEKAALVLGPKADDSETLEDTPWRKVLNNACRRGPMAVARSVPSGRPLGGGILTTDETLAQWGVDGVDLDVDPRR